MNFLSSIQSDEKGSVLIVAVLVLFILTLMGLAATTTTTIDLQITQSERDYVQGFYVADSGWKEGGNWLKGMAGAPARVNSAGEIVRNFGNGAQDVENNDFPGGTQDGIINGTPYWYRVTYLRNQIAPGRGNNYRQFVYTVTCNANRAQEVEVSLMKTFKVGYY